MEFDMVKFVETLQRSHSLNTRQKNDLIRAARAACGNVLDIQAGDVLKSSRGVRLVIESHPGLFTLISLKSFDDQYAALVGQKVARQDQTLENLEQYIYSRNYVKVGRIENLNLANVLP